MERRYPTTQHVTDDMIDKIDRPVDPALISNRQGARNTTLSYLKVDIIADQLNSVFGPLGWGVEATVHSSEDWQETKNVERNNARTDVEMHMVMVVSNVTLTIKPVTPDGTPTVFKQPGIGYGEVEVGKSRKDAYGMAVKGAATDGLKRCANFLGKTFGMMMASNGSQEDIAYAHNGRDANYKKAQNMRRDGGGSRDRDERPAPRGDARPAARRDDDRGARTTQGAASGRGQDRDGDRQRSDAPRDDRGGGEQQRARGDAPAQRDERQREPERAAAQPGKEGGDAPAARETQPKGRGARSANTDFDLDVVPVTQDEMTDFGATLIERVREMRQSADRVSLVKQHVNTIRNLDPKIRKRVMERLKELEVDVDAIRT